MPLYKVIVKDSITRYAEKVFEAESEEEARDMAEDETWMSENGWTDAEDYETVVDCGVECVEQVDDEDQLDADMPPMAGEDQPHCEVQDPSGYICTRERGHDGDHVAHGPLGENIIGWGQGQ